MTDLDLLTCLRADDNKAFAHLYQMCFPSVLTYIKQNKGTKNEAEDIFQEAMLALLQKVRKTDFELTCTLKTYLCAVAKNLWLKHLRDNKREITQENITEQEVEAFAVEILPETTQEQKLQTWLSRITENCQRILTAIFYLKEPLDKLMVQMGWKNKHTASTQKYKCLEQLKKKSK